MALNAIHRIEVQAKKHEIFHDIPGSLGYIIYFYKNTFTIHSIFDLRLKQLMCTPAPRRPHHGSRNTGQQTTHGDTSATGATGKGGRTQHLRQVFA